MLFAASRNPEQRTTIDALCVAERWSEMGPLHIPVDEKSIGGFDSWIRFNGFRAGHEAYDFLAYRSAGNEAVIGLPQGTEVLSVADGIVADVRGETRHRLPHHSGITIIHSRSPDLYRHTAASPVYRAGVHADYHHVIPKVDVGQHVRAGQPIGEVFYDLGEGTYPAHLHLALYDAHGGVENPEAVFAGLSSNSVRAPCSTDFDIPGGRSLRIVPNTRSGRVEGRSTGIDISFPAYS